MSVKHSVAIVQRRMARYRVPLFELMRRELAARDIHLRVLAGDGTEWEQLKDDSGILDWNEPLPTRYYLGGRACWQPFMDRVRDCDAVIVTQEYKLLNNYFPVLNPWRKQRLAFWGHGRNLQNPSPLAEEVRKLMNRRADWWFAYTASTSSLLQLGGFPSERITVLNNSVDTSDLRRLLANSAREPLASRRRRLDLGPGPIAVFIGSLYAEKRLEWVVSAAARIRRRIPEFRLAVAGTGPDLQTVERAVALGPDSGIVYCGAQHGQAKADLLSCADVVINPGAVGLAVLDAFAAGIPLITTDCGMHGPEIDYLQPGRNGVMTADALSDFVDGCVELLQDGDTMRAMKRAAEATGRVVTLEAMCQNFCNGIEQMIS